MEGTIIDVRTSAEFNMQHVPNSINIPLDEIPNKVEEIKSMKQPLILCCAAGVRSQQAVDYLQSLGVTCENGGGWNELVQ